mmetsp:Transcript_9218/g.29047  ORF Transcript_9218/g.29047 Transcript_9218/m.29047 type:complete len:276 (-) Transcript_9218:564-1391(-)
MHVRLDSDAGEEGHDGGRRLLRAKAVVVARADARAAHDVAVHLDAAREAGRRDHEAHLVLLGLARLHHVHRAAARRRENALHRPVVVLAVAVDALERLLVEADVQAVHVGEGLHELHAHHVLVDGHVRDGEDGRELMLARRDLVVVRGHRAAEEPQLLLQRLAVPRDGVGHRPKITELELLVGGRRRADHGPVAHHQVRTAQVGLLRDDEELLLPADEGAHLGDRLLADQPEEALALLVDRRHRTQQRRLLVEGHSRPCDEARRDVHRLAANKGR